VIVITEIGSEPSEGVVRDAKGQQLAYIHYSNDPERRSAAKLLSRYAEKDRESLPHKTSNRLRVRFREL
jgi:hypothetical protein